MNYLSLDEFAMKRLNIKNWENYKNDKNPYYVEYKFKGMVCTQI